MARRCLRAWCSVPTWIYSDKGGCGYCFPLARLCLILGAAEGSERQQASCSGRSCRCLDLPVEGAVGVAGGLDEGLAQEQREPGVAVAGEPFPEALRHDVLPPARPLLPVKPRTRRKFTPT